MYLNCCTEGRVISKYPRTASNGKTYYHLIIVDNISGESCDIGCSEDVYNYVLALKNYVMYFALNPFYLRKEYSCSINVNRVADIPDHKK